MLMASKGDVQGLDTCSRNEDLGDLWQEIAEVGAAYGHLPVVQLVHSFYMLDMESIGVVARNADHPEIAFWATGESWALDLNEDYEPFPLNIGVDRSIPEQVREWEMLDWDESFEPEDAESTDILPQPESDDRMEIPGLVGPEEPITTLDADPSLVFGWRGYDPRLEPEIDSTTMEINGEGQAIDDEDDYLVSRLQGLDIRKDMSLSPF